MNVANLVSVLASISWLLLIGSILFAGASVARGGRAKSFASLVIGTLALALVLSTVSQGLVFIQPEARAVVISALRQTGIRSQALQPGLRFITPFFEDVVVYPIAKQTYTMSGAAAEGQISGDDSIVARTSDGQEVRIDASVIFSIDPYLNQNGSIFFPYFIYKILSNNKLGSFFISHSSNLNFP